MKRGPLIRWVGVMDRLMARSAFLNSGLVPDAVQILLIIVLIIPYALILIAGALAIGFIPTRVWKRVLKDTQ